MMYGYMTLSDDTGIAHSEMKPDGSVKVYFERPVDGVFTARPVIFRIIAGRTSTGFLKMT